MRTSRLQFWLANFFHRAASASAQDMLIGQRRIALNEDEATRFLGALDDTEEDVVTRLRRLA